jgi:hypothetical protein
MKVHDDKPKPPSPNKHHNISSLPADAICEGGSVDGYVTHVSTNSTQTAYIEPRDWIDVLPKAFNDILPQVNASTPGLRTPRHDETNMLLTEE